MAIKTKGFSLTAFALLLSFTSSLHAQNPTLAWAKQMGGTENDAGNSITTDANGNVYTTGYFSGTVDFDPGVASTKLTSAGYLDIFIQKLDANGNLIWVKQMGGTGVDFSSSITTDAKGNIFTTGDFSGTVDFDPGAGTTNLTSAGSYDIFIQKLDANGNFLWVKQMGGTMDDYGNAIATDANGNVYTTGIFRDVVDFDPGTGIINLTATDYNDIYIQKLDAYGKLLWVKQIVGTGSEFATSLTIDSLGNVYSTGYFEKTVDFDPGTGTTFFTSQGDFDIYIEKLDANGNFLWAKQMGGTGYNSGYSIATDKNGNVFTTGYFKNTVDFDPGAGVANLTSAGAKDVFIQKLDAKGNFLWVKQIGGTYYEEGHSIAIDASGNVITVGFFSGTIDFNPGTGVTNLTSAGSSDMFMQQLDADGNFMWVKQLGGLGEDLVNDITIEANGNIYTTGSFSGTVDFDPGTGTSNTSSAGKLDIFIQKLSANSFGLSENALSNNLLVYPNPTDGKFSIGIDNIQKSVTVRILSLTGQVIVNKQFQNTKNIQLELNQSNGIYMLETIDEQGNKVTLKIVKQ